MACLKNCERLFAAFRTVSCTRVFPEIQLRQVQQGNGASMSTATGQRVRPQLGVRNRAVASTPTYHVHDAFAREEPMHSVKQTTVQRSVILGFQNGLRDLRISTNVFPLSLSGSSNFLQSIVHIVRPSHIAIVCSSSCVLQNSSRRCVDQEDCSKFASPQVTTIVSAWSTLLGISQLRTFTIACVKESGHFDWSESRAALSTPNSSSKTMTRSF